MTGPSNMKDFDLKKHRKALKRLDRIEFAKAWLWVIGVTVLLLVVFTLLGNNAGPCNIWGSCS